MGPLARRALAVTTGVAVALAAITWWALESGGVAIVKTRSSEGAIRSTHVWFAEHDGALWLEVGTPENGWYRDVLAFPRLALEREGEITQWIARPRDDPQQRVTLRRQLRAKYGWRDWWVGWLVDSSHSIPVRLDPAAPSPAPG